MKKLIVFSLIQIFILNISIAQDNVGIGTLNPNPKAILELQANNKGFILPRVTTTERLAINPAQGSDEALLVYDLNDSSFYYWDATRWRNISDVSNAYNISFSFDSATNTISISDNGGILSTVLNLNINDADSNPANEYNTGLFFNNNGKILTITNGGTSFSTAINVDDNDADPTNEIQQLAITQSGSNVSWNLSLNGGNGSFSVDDADSDPTNELQNLSLNSNTLSISNGNSVDLAAYLDNTDNQTLTLNSNLLSISNANSVNLSSYLDNTDNQTLSLNRTGNNVNLSITGGNSVNFSVDDNDWSGAGTGRMYPAALTDKIGIGLNNPRVPLEIGIDVSNGHLRPGTTVLRLTNKENATCAGETFWDFRVGECGQMGVVTNVANANSGFGNFNILNSTDSLLSPGIVASFSTNAPPQSFFVYPGGQPRVAIRDTINDHALYVFDAGDGNAAFFAENDLGNGIEISEAGDGQGILLTEQGIGNAIQIEEFDNGGGIVVTERGNGSGLFINQSAGESAATANGYGIIMTSTGTNEPIYVNHNGNIAYLSTAGVWMNASDRTHKTNIRNLTYGLSTVMKLRPVSYNMKSNNAPQIGFIAQEVKKIIPELVEGEEGSMTMSYGQLTSVLVKAIQELKEIVEQQGKKISELESKLTH